MRVETITLVENQLFEDKSTSAVETQAACSVIVLRKKNFSCKQTRDVRINLRRLDTKYLYTVQGKYLLQWKKREHVSVNILR